MRIWHKDLICVLPKNQLLGQWRELCLIAKNIAEKGTPNHILVNQVMRYPDEMLDDYAEEVYNEMIKRGYHPDWHAFKQYRKDKSPAKSYALNELYPGWHTSKYMQQCLMNLQEKHDCGGIPDEEWIKIIHFIFNDWENMKWVN